MLGTSLVAQWLRLHLVLQGVQVWSLVREIRAHLSQGQKPKTQNRSNTVTNSRKTFKKWSTFKKKSLEKRKTKFMKWLVGWRMHTYVNPVLVGCAKSPSNWQRVCLSTEKKFVETIKQKVCECLHHMGAYLCGPVSDFVLKEIGDYWEIYHREWQELVHHQFLRCSISAEHRTGILILTRLCASTQGNGKDPTVIGRKKIATLSHRTRHECQHLTGNLW